MGVRAVFPLQERALCPVQHQREHGEYSIEIVFGKGFLQKRTTQGVRGTANDFVNMTPYRLEGLPLFAR